MRIYFLSLAATGLSLLALAAWAWPRRRDQAVMPFIRASALGAMWPLLLALELALPELEWKAWAMRPRAPVTLAAATCLLTMALEHGGWLNDALRRRLRWLAVAPLAGLAFNTMPWFEGWFYHNARPHARLPGVLAYDHGWWAGVHNIYGLLLAIVVVGVLLMQAQRQERIYRRRALILAAGAATPALLYAMHLAGLSRWTAFNLPALGMGVTGACGAWALLRCDWFDLAPLARAEVFEGLPSPVLVFDARGRLLDCNHAARRELGEVAPGTGVGALDEPWRGLRDPLLCGAPLSGMLSEAYVWEARPVRDHTGAVRGYAVVCHEVARLLESHRLETVGRLAGGVAHEFNNLLTVVTGYASVLLSRVPEEAPEHAALEAIARASEDAAQLTSQLLSFSRRQMLRPLSLDVAALLRDAGPAWRTLLGEGIALRLPPPGQPAWVRADPDSLRSAFTELLLNAAEAMPEGGLVIVEAGTVSAPESCALTAGEYALITVCDTGCGMDAETRARACEPFFSTKGVRRGSGLGLSSVYGLVRQSEGLLELDSVPGAGTTVRIYLPAAGDERLL